MIKTLPEMAGFFVTKSGKNFLNFQSNLKLSAK